MRIPNHPVRVAEATASVDAAREVLLRDLRDRAATSREASRSRLRIAIVSRRGQAFRSHLPFAPPKPLNASTGGLGLDLSNPVQRAWRDANAVGRHISNELDAVGTMYGQLALG